MNAAAHGVEGNASAPVSYMAPEPGNTIWRAVFGDGSRCRQVVGESVRLQKAVAETKDCFGPANSTRVPSCCEAGRDGLPGSHRCVRATARTGDICDGRGEQIRLVGACPH